MTTATMTLTEFLLARIAEDEAVAREVLPFVNAEAGERIQIHLTRREGDESWSKMVEPYDPRRVLAECEAKRRIVEIHREYMEECYECSARNNFTWPCRTLLALAAVYADHPDYRDEWATGSRR